MTSDYRYDVIMTSFLLKKSLQLLFIGLISSAEYREVTQVTNARREAPSLTLVVLTIEIGFEIVFSKSKIREKSHQKHFIRLRGWWPSRRILALGRYFTGISIVENLGLLIFGTDTSKSCLTRANLTFWNFLGQFPRHQVVAACSDFQQCDEKVHKKCG